MVISVRGPERGVCVHISGEDYVWYVCEVLYAVLYIHVNCFVVRGCAVSRRYINICNSDVFNVVNMSVVNVMLSPLSVMSPSPAYRWSRW